MQRNEWDLPDPPDARPVKGVNLWNYLIGVLIGIALLAAAFYVPIPWFYAYLPGPIRDIEDLVRVSGTRSYSSEGSLYLTTVSVDTQVTSVDLVASMFDPQTSIVRKEAITGGRSLQRLKREQRQQMRESKQHAREVALSALGLGKPVGDGAEVVRTVPRSPAARVLRPGDLIVAIDGRRVQTTCDVGAAIDRHEIGEQVEVVVRRRGRRRVFRLETVRHPEDPRAAYIGVAMEEVNYRFNPGVDVRFRTGQIAGPSAGLMFTLALYDRLTPDDLTAGRRIAGTGTIACDGGVGPIGGIEQKIASAEREGAEIFLTPRLNVPNARAVADELEIVAVSTFDDAVEYLEALQ